MWFWIIEECQEAYYRFCPLNQNYGNTLAHHQVNICPKIWEKVDKSLFGFFSEFIALLIDDHIEARAKNNLIFGEEECKYLENKKMDEHPVVAYMMKKMDDELTKNGNKWKKNAFLFFLFANIKRIYINRIKLHCFCV